MIDYKKLLANYIYHVAQIEGTTFINIVDYGFNFNDKDLKELQYLADKSYNDNPPYPYDSDYEGNWISVEDELPEQWSTCLVFGASESENEILKCTWSGYKFLVSGILTPVWNATHWMHLPKEPNK